MIYREFQGKKLSMLGMGCMRLPGGRNNAGIDVEATAKMVEHAIRNGVNYFDTAWGYHGGMSEPVIGKLLQKYPRDSFYIATKFPGYDLSNMDKVEQIFEQQLARTGMEYFDFYLFHNVCDRNVDAYLDPQYGIYDYLKKQKQAGRIKHLGFSIHADLDVMHRFLDAYGESIEFCQIQLNWLDWSFQDAKAKVELLQERNIPIWVMEPLRGGKLATLPGEDVATLKALRREEGIPAWSFRFLQSIKGVTMVLSGMSNFEQVADNIHTFSTDAPLNGEEWETLLGIADKMLSRPTLSCTSCRYCTEKCPQELDIPHLLALYNEQCFSTDAFMVRGKLSALSPDKQPSACLGCRGCEAVCPQEIKISEALADFAVRMR